MSEIVPTENCWKAPGFQGDANDVPCVDVELDELSEPDAGSDERWLGKEARAGSWSIRAPPSAAIKG